MKTILASLVLFAAPLFGADLIPADLEVHKDLQKAKSVAKESGRPIYLEFMSSTCPHCQAYHESVIGEPAFINYANENLVPVIFDYNKLPELSEERREEIRTLMQDMGVRGFPTYFLLKPDGSVMLRNSGYGGRDTNAVIDAFQEAIDAKMSPADS